MPIDSVAVSERRTSPYARFPSSCTHRDEPGCAIRAAVKDGRIDERRYSLLLKLHEETRVNAPASWRR